MSQRKVSALVLLALLALPGALAHEEEKHVEPGTDTETGESWAPNDGYTGPGYEPYVYFIEGVWLYGQASVTPLGEKNLPRNIRGHGDWLVWEDANHGDIYAYSLSAGMGYYLTNDAAPQRYPQIHGNVVVFEDYRNGRANVVAHFLDTGEQRLLSTGPGNHRRPSIHGDLVVWEDDRSRNTDVWGARLSGGGEFPIVNTSDKETEPIALDGVVYFRTFRFNIWDVHGFDLERNETFPVTSDVLLQSAPFTNGRDVLFLTQFQGTGWRLDRYDVQTQRITETKIRSPDSALLPASGEHVLQQARDVGMVQIVARNLTTGTTTHVSGNLALVTDPFLMGRTAYAAVATTNGTSLLALDVSPFAFGAQPRLTIVNPTSAIMPWTRPLAVQGILTTGPGWTEPVTFTYRVNGGPPQIIPPEQNWRVTLDNAGAAEGNHRVVFRATFREGPPVETAIHLVVPLKNAHLDLGEIGPQYHAAKTMAALNAYVLANPASWFLIPIVLFLLLLVAIRLWIALRPKRELVVAEYVPQDGE